MFVKHPNDIFSEGLIKQVFIKNEQNWSITYKDITKKNFDDQKKNEFRINLSFLFVKSWMMV